MTLQNIIRKYFDQKRFSTPHQSHLIWWHHFEYNIEDLSKNLENGGVSIKNLKKIELLSWNMNC